ncbi:MAG: zf-HC2 domain-containing protein [Candidatus Omnitrophica bacterium]|nr:zf-HC2 domain-containing protein [Candidatus Omnitrophota bacterium]MCB9719286.1 zf-HC2 domain-containing protein [Candidatus Omnitrophota bacterium]
MKCEKVKELVLTDYVDGQLETAEKVRLVEHLKTCASCHEFAQAVEKELVAPFADLERPEVPPVVWQNIRTAIVPEEEPEPAGPAFIRFLDNLRSLRPALLILAGVVFVFMLSTLFTKSAGTPEQIAQPPVIQQQLAAQEGPSSTDELTVETYLASLDDDYDDVYDLAENGYGTALEEYFL